MKITKVLIGVDDSVYARNAAIYGFDLARTYNAAVGLVHIIEPVIYPVNSNDSITGLSIDPVLNLQQEGITGIQEKQSSVLIESFITEFGNGLDVTSFTEFDITADGIIACASQFNASFIVVGTHKRSGFDRLFMGDVAEDIVKQSPIPILVVPFVEE